jgi:hypothetical protein
MIQRERARFYDDSQANRKGVMMMMRKSGVVEGVESVESCRR